ncbi:MAG: C45 family peptidase [Alphaproteobacteria bacterium]
MDDFSLTFDAVAEAKAGPKWRARWHRSWPSYQAWFLSRDGDGGPSRATCEAALGRHMPELLPVHHRLVQLAGGGDRAARFLSTWCPPAYLGGCSLAACADEKSVRLVRNYDLSPDLNEGLLLRSEWSGMPVMGMIEFLWGLSDGVNQAGLCAALAFGGRSEVREGFGVTTILRYVLETCASVAEALTVLRRVPSHMAYNIVLADSAGATATAELIPGGGVRMLQPAIATNHQHGEERADYPAFTNTGPRRVFLNDLVGAEVDPKALTDAFLKHPLFQTDYARGFGTLFTAAYDPVGRGLTMRWPDRSWTQTLDRFAEGQQHIVYDDRIETTSSCPSASGPDLMASLAEVRHYLPKTAAARFDRWAADARRREPDWAGFGRLFDYRRAAIKREAALTEAD